MGSRPAGRVHWSLGDVLDRSHSRPWLSSRRRSPASPRTPALARTWRPGDEVVVEVALIAQEHRSARQELARDRDARCQIGSERLGRLSELAGLRRGIFSASASISPSLFRRFLQSCSRPKPPGLSFLAQLTQPNICLRGRLLRSAFPSGNCHCRVLQAGPEFCLTKAGAAAQPLYLRTPFR